MAEEKLRYKTYNAPAGGWGAAAATAKVLLQQSVIVKGSEALLKMNKPETQWAVVGCLASAVLGAQMPAFAVALSSVIAVFYEPVRLSV